MIMVKTEDHKGLLAIIEERFRQIRQEGWTAEHDDQHTRNELSSYAVFMLTMDDRFWPPSWDYTWKEKVYTKPFERRLEIAGALIAAELDRIKRMNDGSSDKSEEAGDTERSGSGSGP